MSSAENALFAWHSV